MSWVPIPVKRYLSNLLTDYVERGGDADLGAVTADVIDTDRVLSESVGPQIRVFTVNGETYALANESVIDSGSDPTAVWQSAVDHANSLFNETGDNERFVGAIVSGMGETVPLSSQLTVNQGVGIVNVTFDGQGSNGIVFQNDAGNFAHSLYTRNVGLKNAPATGVRMNDVIDSTFINFTVAGASEHNIRIDSCIGNVFVNLLTVNAGGGTNGNGLLFQSNGATGAHSNANTFIGGRAFNCDLYGARLTTDCDANTFQTFRFENCSDSGVYDQGRGNSYENCWVESNGTHGLQLAGYQHYVSSLRAGDITNYAISLSGENITVDGFDGKGTQTIAVNSAATECELFGIRAADLAADNGTRTVINGWGENAGDPNSTGDWNANGYEGASVVDTTNSARYVYRGGSWI